MDIKKRIQELSLDQKAKLYFMGLVRQGKIDTLPEDPKAAYIRDMMDKDDYGRSVSGKDKRTFMEPEDSMPAARAKKMMGMESKEDKLKMAYAAYDKAEMNGDIRGQELALAVIDLLKSGELKEIATKLGYLKEMKVTDKDGNDVTSDIIKKLEKSLEKSGYKITKGYSSDADIRPGYKTRPMKEVDGMEGGVDLNAISVKKASFMYTEQGGNFYSLTLSTSDNKQIRFGWKEYNEANEWLKDTLAYIHEGDLIPKKYNSGLEDLDLIVKRLEELGIEASHGDYMDVS